MRKISLGIMALGLVCLMLGLTAVNAGEKIVLRCADVHSYGYPTVEGVLYMSRLVKEQTDGRIEIIVYPESKLGSEASVVAMVRTGVLEMGRISVTQVAEVAPEFGVFVLPYLFKNNVHKWKVLDGAIGTRLLSGLERVGLVGLCFQEAGYRSFYNSKHPIYRPEDLKGLRIRVQPNDIMVKLIDFLGAYPVPINYEEIDSALAARIIDGAENNIPSYYSAGHYQQASYYSFDRHSSIPEILLMSQ
ncbi:MAG TPA: TRAP transporter substrate-binding protein DctP, partial [Bacillota bacterium]|nr:TRAP transporter substrate-binding protein DctP [Bacillota bacterium]